MYTDKMDLDVSWFKTKTRKILKTEYLNNFDIFYFQNLHICVVTFNSLLFNGFVPVQTPCR